MRWPGFRKVRRQVCRRVARRLRDLDLAGVAEYRIYLAKHPDEWERLDGLCRITISRFYRDRGMFDALADAVLPALVRQMRRRGESALRIWSAGCGSGEEPYTLAVVWAMELEPRHPGVRLDIVATDVDARVLHRAREACYAYGTLKRLPDDWRDRAFMSEGDSYRLKPDYRRGIEFLQQDIRVARPRGPFDLVLCRNLVFTYFDDALQRELLTHIGGVMQAGAALVLGAHEALPEPAAGFESWFEQHRIYRKSANAVPTDRDVDTARRR